MMEVMKLHAYRELACTKECTRKHVPEDAEDTIVEVHQADIRSGDPDIEDVDDERDGPVLEDVALSTKITLVSTYS